MIITKIKELMKQLLMFLTMLPLAASAYDAKIGVLYFNLNSSDMTATVTYKERISASETSGDYSGDIVIPGEVTYNNTTYRVTSIGHQAFFRCTELTSVSIPNTVTTLESYAFYYCSSLGSMTIPNSVKTIGYIAFCGCKEMKTLEIGNGVTSIGDGAFSYCSGLTSVVIPSSVTTIEEGAF